MGILSNSFSQDEMVLALATADCRHAPRRRHQVLPRPNHFGVLVLAGTKRVSVVTVEPQANKSRHSAHSPGRNFISKLREPAHGIKDG